MNRPWMDILKRREAETTGVSLVRLAQMAVAEHLAENARRCADPTQDLHRAHHPAVSCDREVSR